MNKENSDPDWQSASRRASSPRPSVGVAPRREPEKRDWYTLTLDVIWIAVMLGMCLGVLFSMLRQI